MDSLTERWRLLDLGVMDPYEAEAITEVLLTALRGSSIQNTLCFRVPRRHVWVGSWSGVNRDYCRREKIPLVREITGVGSKSTAVFDEDILHYTLVSREHIVNDAPLNLSRCMDSILKGLQFMGLDARLRTNFNDILVGGKKVSGSVLGLFHGFPLFTGTMIVDFNYDLCENALLYVPRKFADKEAKSHREWVTTLKTQLGREVLFSEVIFALKKGFEAVLQVEFDVSTSLTGAEEEILEDLQVKYRSDEWTRTGRWSPVKDYWRRS